MDKRHFTKEKGLDSVAVVYGGTRRVVDKDEYTVYPGGLDTSLCFVSKYR